jgi:hypothetical protein
MPARGAIALPDLTVVRVVEIEAVGPDPTTAMRTSLLLVLLFLLGSPLTAQESSTSTAPAVSFHPAVPVQGHLFTIRIRTDVEDVTLWGGSVAGESLHFHRAGPGIVEALAAVPIDVEGSLPVELRLGSGAPPLRHEVQVAPGEYRHERLTVAPRYGSPLGEEDQRRLDEDAAKARLVSEVAHATPRLWSLQTILPRADRVTSGFGDGREFNGQISSRHMGLDLDGEPGDTVFAAAEGVVQLVDAFLLAGNIVYLNHGAGLISGYFHLSEQLVEEGERVSAGDPIGRVGATGRVTGPHLHWVVRYGYISVDPRSLLTQTAPVR